MASTSVAVLQRLQQRATQAEQLITQLRNQLTGLREDTAVRACQHEEVQLQTANAQLRLEAEVLKQRLVTAEIRNGLKQYSLPQPGSVPAPLAAAAIASAAPPSDTPAKQDKPAAQEKSTANDKPAAPEKQQKKKEKKEGKKQEPKPAAAEAAPVDVSRLDMRIGFIVECKKHPDADGLYVEQVDLGEGRNRTIVSGLVQHVPLEQMQERLAIFACNLKPAKMRGILSEGMIMCASSPEKVEILIPPPGVVKGDRVTVPGFSGQPDALLNPKKKIWEQIQPDFQVDAEGVATYKGTAWEVTGKGQCKAPTARKMGIK